MVLFDSSMLLFFLDKRTPSPLDPNTRKPIEHAKERIDYLIKTLQEDGSIIVIPTPVLSEVLVRAGKAGSDYIQILNGSAKFRIAPFDTRAAIEVASMARSGKKKEGLSSTYAKIKYDRQIVAIAKTERVTTIYSDDKDLRTLAQAHAIKPYGLADLPLPPSDQQTSLLDHVES